MEGLKYCENYQNVIQKHEVSNTVRKVVPTDLYNVATNHQFIKKKKLSANKKISHVSIYKQNEKNLITIATKGVNT